MAVRPPETSTDETQRNQEDSMSTSTTSTNANSRDCDHRRGPRHRSSAITVCRHCLDFLCSICGATIDWHEGLCVANPGVQWRYCAKDACVAAEAAYHALPVGEMIQRRGELRGKRVLLHLQDRGIEPPILPAGSSSEGIVVSRLHYAFRPERIPAPRRSMLDPGEACWCNLGKDCVGDHEIGPIEVVNVCGDCGQEFRISGDDPHWSTGRGPTCPTRHGKS